MNIVHISIYPEHNKKYPNMVGLSWYSKNLITNTHYDKKDKVYILCNKINERYEKFQKDNLHIIRCFDRNIKFIPQLSKEIKTINPDIIHIQQELGLFGSSLTAYLLQWFIYFHKKYKIVITLHGVVSLKAITKQFIRENNSSFPVWLVRIAFYLIYRPLCIWSDKIIVHEENLKEILINEYLIKR